MSSSDRTPVAKTEIPQHLVGTLSHHRDGRQTHAVERFEKWRITRGQGMSRRGTLSRLPLNFLLYNTIPS